MNRQMFRLHHSLVVVAIVGLFAALIVPAAFAGGTTHGTYTVTNGTFDDPAGDICPFAITITYNASVQYTYIYDRAAASSPSTTTSRTEHLQREREDARR